MWGSAVSACQKAADVTPATRRRLLGDLKRLQEEPLPLCAARPCSDDDLTLWHGVIGVDMDVTHIGRITVPLHFLIDFPYDYPQTAPNIGFSFEFSYRGGAEYVMRDGRLKGKKVICLDVLGNFGNVHREWKNEVGSGWSPAYTVTTLLVQLQSVLCNLGTDMSQGERDVTYQSAVRFSEKSPGAVLELLDEEDIRERRAKRGSDLRIANVCSGDKVLAERVDAFVKQVGLCEDAAKLDLFLNLLADVAKGGSSASSWSVAASCSVAESSDAACESVDANICCFASGKLYTESLLGVGVSRERKNLATAAELLSKEAYDGGLRKSTDKSPFEFFLPVWINERHASLRQEWRDALRSSYMEIGSAVFEVSGEDDAILEVFPRLINQMLVEVMKPDAAKSAAIATFEGLCNFWRTFRWLVDTRSTLADRIRSMLSKFVSSEDQRHKDNTPDLGMMLVSFSVFQGHSGCPSREEFAKAYADENSLRWVMWWQRSGTKAESTPVFQATQVSREIFMFQMMVLDVVVAEVSETLAQIESTNCKLPARLEDLQKRWREQKVATESWSTYFKAIGAPQPAFGSTNEWIANCVERAAKKGPKYGGAKGGAKGDGKGKKGGGKGGGKGKGGKGKHGYYY